MAWVGGRGVEPLPLPALEKSKHEGHQRVVGAQTQKTPGPDCGGLEGGEPDGWGPNISLPNFVEVRVWASLGSFCASPGVEKSQKSKNEKRKEKSEKKSKKSKNEK